MNGRYGKRMNERCERALCADDRARERGAGIHSIHTPSSTSCWRYASNETGNIKRNGFLFIYLCAIAFGLVSAAFSSRNCVHKANCALC